MSRNKEASSLPVARPVRLWLFGAFCLFLPAVVFLYQVLTPSDGARASKDPEAWTRQGIVLHIYSRIQSGLQEGDLLVAVDGEKVESLVESLFHLRQFKGAWGKDPPAVYQVVRDGRIVLVETLITRIGL